MRFIVGLIAITLVCCAGPGTVAVYNSGAGIQFSFLRRGTPSVDVRAVDVFEDVNRSRGRTICRIHRTGLPPGGSATFVRWTYGSTPPSHYEVAKSCEPLVPHRRYGVMGYLGRTEVYTIFEILDDGSVVCLESCQE
jgi:hypothetical protein